MPKIVIKRKSEYKNKARKIGIYIDDKKVGTINDGEDKEYQVDSGKHLIHAKVDWCTSQKMEFDLSENEIKTFVLDSYKYGGFITQVILGILLLYYLMKYAFDLQVDFLIVPVGIGFIYQMYFITFGKNKYLNLTEKNKNVLQHRV